jgi:hypothetical protein
MTSDCHLKGTAGMATSVETKLQDILDKVFAHDSCLYQRRGFQRQIGYGRKPALVNIDLANAWTRPGNSFSCVGMDTKFGGVEPLENVLPYLKSDIIEC